MKACRVQALQAFACEGLTQNGTTHARNTCCSILLACRCNAKDHHGPDANHACVRVRVRVRVRVSE